MPKPTLYDSYPHPGDVVVLCEGDVAGYEVSLLKRWTGEQFPAKPLVDIWAGGTAEAIFGLSDALGRARPVVVMEDLDFRSPSEAKSDCDRARKDRRAREVRLLAWRAWHRNEIENYFLETEVFLPSMAFAFNCSETDVKSAVEDVLPALAEFQAAQYALYRAHRGWKGTMPASALRRDLSLHIHPAWNDTTLRPSGPSGEKAATTLAQNVLRWQQMFLEVGDPFKCPLGEALVPDFHAKHAEWDGMKYGPSPRSRTAFASTRTDSGRPDGPAIPNGFCSIGGD